ncbi:MAG: Fic family protein [Opitutales bacterium]|nr:Fic family protein [Opitutales bacterium]MCH8541232.1 Fic family protein [Opitutales bacterium]
MNVYSRISAMEPLLPRQGRAELSELSSELLRKIGRLSGQVHSPVVRGKLAVLLRWMNCYYSNLIEGHKTEPRAIEQALQADYSDDPKKRENQKLSHAHIEVESLMVERLENASTAIYEPAFLQWLHREFYERLPESMRVAKTRSGETYRIVPGALRDFMVDVGRHTPPHYKSLSAFLERFCACYGGRGIYETDRLSAIAAAHHRLGWIHPFGDGNGRVMRLYSQAMLVRHELDGAGLWSLSRGLARQRQSYYSYLDRADQPRQGDRDGRGLADFCTFFLETMLDQVDFMSARLDLPGLRARIERFFQFEMMPLGKDAEFLMRVVRALADEGEFPRARVQELTGRKETFCRRIIRLGLDEGLIESPRPKGVLRISFPAKVLDGYFPKLYLDLET